MCNHLAYGQGSSLLLLDFHGCNQVFDIPLQDCITQWPLNLFAKTQTPYCLRGL